MPRQTFHNLDLQRQETILEACFKEFAQNDYQNASVSNIVKELKISKGGFYRYFENKKDLYMYLIEKATQMRLKNVENLFSGTNDFFEIIVKNFYEKIRFDIDFPIHGQFLYNMSQERFSDDLGDLMLQTKARIMELTKMMMSSYQAGQKIRSDIETDIIAFTIVQVQLGVYDYLLIKHKIDLKDTLKGKNPSLVIPEAEIMEVVKGFAEILKSGLKPATT